MTNIGDVRTFDDSLVRILLPVDVAYVHTFSAYWTSVPACTGIVHGVVVPRCLIDDGSLIDLISPESVKLLDLTLIDANPCVELKLADDSSSLITQYVLFPLDVEGRYMEAVGMCIIVGMPVELCGWERLTELSNVTGHDGTTITRRIRRCATRMLENIQAELIRSNTVTDITY